MVLTKLVECQRMGLLKNLLQPTLQIPGSRFALGQQPDPAARFMAQVPGDLLHLGNTGLVPIVIGRQEGL
ncbi:MAG: hypothetical protein CMJ87_11300 [Planctomycetes bacterium]|nr:hypothetical protein [Planctomycetota bacterium]